MIAFKYISAELDPYMAQVGLRCAGTFRASRELLSLRRVQERIIYQCCSMLQCDRASLFLIDAQTGEMVLQRGKGVDSIRIPASSGIVGHVAQTGETLNVPDAYADARFSKQSDADLKYVTKNILCVPVRDGKGQTIAVLQAINKFNGSFSTDDQTVLEKLTMLAGISLRNAQLFEDAKKQHHKVQSLLDVIRTMTSNMGLNSIIFTITQRFPGVPRVTLCLCCMLTRCLAVYLQLLSKQTTAPFSWLTRSVNSYGLSRASQDANLGSLSTLGLRVQLPCLATRLT